MALKSLVAVLIGGCAILVAAPVSADETGLAGIHSFRRESGRTCFADHWHTWSGGVQKTKPAALAAAVQGLGQLHGHGIRLRLGTFLARRREKDLVLEVFRRLWMHGRGPALQVNRPCK